MTHFLSELVPVEKELLLQTRRYFCHKKNQVLINLDYTGLWRFYSRWFHRKGFIPNQVRPGEVLTILCKKVGFHHVLLAHLSQRFSMSYCDHLPSVVRPRPSTPLNDFSSKPLRQFSLTFMRRLLLKGE